MSVTGSRRHDLPQRGQSHCLSEELRLPTSRRPELAPGIYTSDASHPFGCSYQPRTPSVAFVVKKKGSPTGSLFSLTNTPVRQRSSLSARVESSRRADNGCTP